MRNPRRLQKDMRAFRIGDPNGEFPIWDTGGAKLAAGRWHEAGAQIIYAAENYSTAMLEKLVHFSGDIPPNQHFIEITIPSGITYEVVNPDHIPGWADSSGDAARQFGRAWYNATRSVMLIVPSVVARMERNFVFNALHADFSAITPGLETPIWWDKRLFE